MTRVIAGTAGGRRLKVPEGDRTRPTTDRIKEALFSSLGDLHDEVVLDLFAGTGALGIEAISRGATRAVFVESDHRVVPILRENLQHAGVADDARVVPSTAAAFCNMPTGGPFTLLFADPPYDLDADALHLLLQQLIAADAVRPDARIIIERSSRSTDAMPGFLSHVRDRTYGETVLRHFILPPTTTPQTVIR